MTVKCPLCREYSDHPEEYIDRIVTCPRCKHTFYLRSECKINNKEKPVQPQIKEYSQFIPFGTILMVIGICVVSIASFLSVTRVFDGEQIYNIGLIHQRQFTLVVGSLIVLVGSLFLGFGHICDAITNSK